MPLTDPFFNDLEASACYDDGAINPSQILIPQIDADELEEYARNLRRAGQDIGTGGNDIVTDWGGLNGAYQAPETELMLSAVDRVATDGDTVETGTDGLATALIDFAAEVRVFKTRFHGLRGDATALRSRINEDEDWRDDEDLVEEHNDLVSEVDKARQEWEEAEIECANTITALFDGPTFTRFDEMEGDGYSGNEIPYGFSEIPEGMEMPWGTAQNVSEGFAMDAWDGAADLAVGAAQDVGGITGLWHDDKWGVPIFGEQGRANFSGYTEENLEGLALLTGFYDPTKPEGDQWGVDDFGEWTDNFLPAIREVGQGIVPTDEWDERKGYVVSQGVINVVLIVGGIALTASGVGAPAGVPMLLAGARAGLRATNNVGTMNIPDFHNDAAFRLPGVPHLDLSGGRGGGGGGGGGFWSSLPGGAWLSDLLKTRESLDDLGGNGSTPPNADPSPTRPRDGTGDPTDPTHDRTRSNDEEIDSGVSATEVETGLRDLEDYVRRHAEDPDMLLEEINRRQGNEVVEPHRTPDLVGAGNGPSASSGSTFTNSAGGGGGDVDTPTSGRGGTTESSSGGGDSGSGSHGSGDHGRGGHGSGSSGQVSGDLGPVKNSPNGRGDPVPITSDHTDFPGPKERFGDGIDLKPNQEYRLLDEHKKVTATYVTDADGKIIEIRTEVHPNSTSPEFLNPRPDATYHVKVGNGEYTFKTDSNGRTVYAEGELEPGKQKRNETEQKNVNKMGDRYFELLNEQLKEKFEVDNGRPPEPGEIKLWDRPQWNGGHIFGSSEFLGPGEKLNQAPMLDIVNQERKILPGIQGSFRRAEWTWHGLLNQDTKALKKGLGDKYEAQMQAWQPILDSGPTPPSVKIQVSLTQDPNLKPIIDPKTGEKLPPPPDRVVVDWSINGVKQKQLDYDNLPSGPT